MFPPISSPEASDIDVGKALYIPMGVASPLWFLFAGATTAGLAYWWMTRWPTLATNLEAMFEPVASPEIALPVPEPEPTPPEVLAEAVAEIVPAAALVEEPAVIEEASPLEAEPEAKPVKAAKPKLPPADEAPVTH